MALFDKLYSSLDDFSSKGGHIRRRILLKVYKQQEEQKKQLNADWNALFNCSPLEHPEQWQVLFDKVTTTAIKLAEISNELKKLEYAHANFDGNLPY